jgi:uncharacterized protein YggT (Ycf19 family)
MVDNKLAIEEAERAANYEAVKSDVQADVDAKIAANARTTDPEHARRIEEISDDMRRTAVDEVVDTRREIERGRVAARVSQVVDYVFFLVYGLLLMRLLLELFAARESAGFYKFITGLTDPLYYPFRGLLPSISTSEGFTLVLSLVFAIVAYMLLHLAVIGLLRLIGHRKVEI